MTPSIIIGLLAPAVVIVTTLGAGMWWLGRRFAAVESSIASLAAQVTQIMTNHIPHLAADIQNLRNDLSELRSDVRSDRSDRRQAE